MDLNSQNSNEKRKIVLFSGGLASFTACKRVIEKHGKEDLSILFFDTKIEDEDTYRFINDCETYFDYPIERLADGRNMWQVFQDERFIGNSYKCVCTRVLKRELLIKILKKRYPKNDVILFFGLEPFETQRIQKVEYGWSQRKIEVQFPLLCGQQGTRKIYQQEIDECKIKIPRFYQLGFRHNNCGGACVRAGIQQWIHLLRIFPERFMWHELQEEETRRKLNKDVSILRDRRNGITKPLTLRDLRLRIYGD